MEYHHLQDRSQNFWVLGSIQSAALGIPGIIVGGQIAAKYGAGTAIVSVVIGNLLLWLVGLAVVSMAALERRDAIENVKQYLGKKGQYAASWILIGAFLGWYIIQIKTSTVAMGEFARDHFEWEHVRGWVGSLFGVMIAVLSIKGIELIKKVCVYCLPFLFLFMLYGALSSGMDVSLEGAWDFSLPGIVMAMIVTLPGIVNLPTFFRHSRSRADSILGLSVMTFFVSAFQILSIFQGIHEPEKFFRQYLEGSYALELVLSAIFAVLSLVCVNLVNIYFAAAGLKTFIAPKWYKYGYVVEGLAGALLFHFSFPVHSVEVMLSNFISCLGVVLLVAFLVKNLIKHRVRRLDVSLNVMCWVVGCGVAIVAYVTMGDSPKSLLAGVTASLLSFLIVLFLEETVWAAKRLKLD